MNWFYFGVSVFLVISGTMTVIKPIWLKNLMQIIVQKDLFFIPGVIEIGIGLGTLYYRDQTKMTWFVYLAGLMLFFDGIFYVLMSKRLREMYEWFRAIEDRKIRSYAMFMLVLAAGYILAAVS